jgi:hypothetical protein
VVGWRLEHSDNEVQTVAQTTHDFDLPVEPLAFLLLVVANNLLAYLLQGQVDEERIVDWIEGSNSNLDVALDDFSFGLVSDLRQAGLAFYRVTEESLGFVFLREVDLVWIVQGVVVWVTSVYSRSRNLS